MIHAQHQQRPWVVIVEPDFEAKLFVGVTPYTVSQMTERSLQVTYRKGRAFSAYLHLSHQTGEKSAKTVSAPDGLADRLKTLQEAMIAASDDIPASTG